MLLLGRLSPTTTILPLALAAHNRCPFPIFYLIADFAINSKLLMQLLAAIIPANIAPSAAQSGRFL